MKRVLKKFIACSLIGLIISLNVNLVFAAGEAVVYETDTSDDKVVLYAGGFETPPSVEVAQIRNTLIDDVVVNPLGASNSIKTLIMMDNSVSIPKEDREKSIAFIEGFIDAASSSEQIRLALFSEHVNYISDYTCDKAYLHEAVSSIEFKDQETYLTDVLYEVLKDIDANDDSYNRIVVISDGMGNKPIGITEKELDKKLETSQIQIHTLGCKKKDNTEELKTMYSVARNSNGKEYTLSDYPDVGEIVSELSGEIGNIYAFDIILPDELKDGLSAGVLITLSSGDRISKEVVMPFGEAKANVETMVETVETSAETTTEEYIAPTVAEEPVKEKEKESGPPVILIIPILLLAIGAYVFILISNKKNKLKSKGVDRIKTAQDNAFANRAQVNHEDSETVIEDMDNYNQGDETDIFSDDNDETELYQDGPSGSFYAKQLILTTMDGSNQRFSCVVDGSMVIGRNHSEKGIHIDIDYSISKRHCIVYTENGRVFIQDLHSTNGTSVNERQVLGNCEIHSGDKLTLGRISFMIEIK